MNEVHLHTRAPFAGHDMNRAEGAVKPAIQLSSTYVFPDAATGAAHMETKAGVSGAALPPEDGWIYSRIDNPTTRSCEERIAAWDGAERSLLFASGMAAISTAVMAWSSKDRCVWFITPLYGGSDHLFREILPSLGIQTRVFSDVGAMESFQKSTTERPGVIHLETPGNPTMEVQDIARVVRLARSIESDEFPVKVMVDNTFLGPVYQRPLELGADMVIYSATKYIGGHSDVIAGAVSGDNEVMDAVMRYRTFLGGVASPHTAWLLMRSMETLHLRMERQQMSARLVADFLRIHPCIEEIRTAFPEDLTGEAQAVAKRQTTGGGSMISITVRGGRQAAFAVLDALRHFKLAVSLGSTESLAEHPYSMTHAGVPVEDKLAQGITEGMIRLSVGIEHPNDLIDDLQQALAVLCLNHDEVEKANTTLQEV